MLIIQQCPWCGEQTIAPCTQFQVTEEGCWMIKPDPDDEPDSTGHVILSSRAGGLRSGSSYGLLRSEAST